MLNYELLGTWTLGEFKVSLPDIGAVVIDKTIWSDKQKAQKPYGFFVTCTDRLATKIELFGFSYTNNYKGSKGVFVSLPYYTTTGPRVFLPFEYQDVIVGIAFEDIDSVEFTDEKPDKNWVKWNPSMTVKLRSVKELYGKSGKPAWRDQYFSGKTMIGNYSLHFNSIRKIVFNHNKSKNTKRENDGRIDHRSNYDIILKTWNVNHFSFLNGGQLWVTHGDAWQNQQTVLVIKVGRDEVETGFDKIRSVHFTAKGKPNAKLTMNSGETVLVDVLLNSTHAFFCGELGGNLKGLGPGRIKKEKVKYFEIVPRSNYSN